MLKLYREPFIQEIKEDWLLDKGLRLFIKREDVIHPLVSGNKWRKLYYNLEQAVKEGHHTLLTFGGAYSNHLYATAAAAKECKLKAIGIIRGDELKDKPLNSTLSFAKRMGMHLVFVDRETYRNKNSEAYTKALEQQYGRFYRIPEGGSNSLALLGCREMVNEEVKEFDRVYLPVGTGGTISGLIMGMEDQGIVQGISVLKGGFLEDEVQRMLTSYVEEGYCTSFPQTEWSIDTAYHFGGYARYNEELLEFIRQFEENHHILLDHVYTGKMIYAIYDKAKKDHFQPGTRLLAIHTGGLQGRL